MEPSPAGLNRRLVCELHLLSASNLRFSQETVFVDPIIRLDGKAVNGDETDAGLVVEFIFFRVRRQLRVIQRVR